MNPLTQVKRIQNLNSKEAALGISDEASWHAKYKDSAYVYVGGIPFDLTEGDLLAVFAQYGEIVDVNLVRDKGTGKSKGFAFIAYENQRSTNLAVDNLNGAQILGRIIRVDHVTNYKKKEEEDEETERQKREARGVCRAFQRGECTRGAGCKFSHDEQRAANSGWGAEEQSRWGHDKFGGSMKSANKFGNERSRHYEESDGKQEKKTMKHDRTELEHKSTEDHRNRKDELAFEPKSRENYDRRDEYRMREVHRKVEKRSRRDADDFQRRTGEQTHRMDERRYRSEYKESQPKEDDETVDEERRRRHESGADIKHNHEKRRRDKSVSGRDSSY